MTAVGLGQQRSQAVGLGLESLPVAAHLRGMRPAPSSQKDTLMLREKLKHYIFSTRL